MLEKRKKDTDLTPYIQHALNCKCHGCYEFKHILTDLKAERMKEDEREFTKSPLKTLQDFREYPNYYKSGEKDLYSVETEKYGLDTWPRHAEMECLQYLWRAVDKGSYKEDITKVKIICERILKEISTHAKV